MLAIGEKRQLFYNIEHSRSISARLYDRAMPRLSALWPDGLQWPGHIPRPLPQPEHINRVHLERAPTEPVRGSIPGLARKLRPTRPRASVKVIEGSDQ